jgi:hypothetical protein
MDRRGQQDDDAEYRVPQGVHVYLRVAAAKFEANSGWNVNPVIAQSTDQQQGSLGSRLLSPEAR